MSVTNSGPERAAYVAAALAAVGLCPRGTRYVKHRRVQPPSTHCSGCGGDRDRGPAQRYCKACHAAHARRTRPKHSELDPEARKRANVRRLSSMLVARGKMDKLPCACGSRNVTAVHLNFDDPFAVVWKCKACRTGVPAVVAA